MTVHVELRRGAYHDSVSLLQVSRAVAGTAGVEAAQVAMATELNCDVLRGMGFDVPPEAGPNDLVVALRAEDEEAVRAGLAAVDHELSALRSEADPAAAEEVPPMTLGSAVRRSGAGLAVVSVPGEHAVTEAFDALAAGASVMLFSDNVPVEDEVRLKVAAARRRPPRHGPRLRHRPRRRRRARLLQRRGAGAGRPRRRQRHRRAAGDVPARRRGRRRQPLPGGRRARPLRRGRGPLHPAGAARPRRRPRHGERRRRLQAARRRRPRPRSVPMPRRSGCASTGPPSAPAARTSPPRSRRPWPPTATSVPDWPQHVAAPEDPALARGPSLRGLFCGGTLAEEAAAIAAGVLGPVASNLGHDPEHALPPDLATRGHAVVDYGADELTRGRAHPMIDPTLRTERIAAEAADPTCGVLLLDLVLGHGAHPDPGRRPRRRRRRGPCHRPRRGPRPARRRLPLRHRRRPAGPRRLPGGPGRGRRVGVPLQRRRRPPRRRRAEEHAMTAPLHGLLTRDPVVATSGVALFADTLRAQAVPVTEVDWRPPARGHRRRRRPGDGGPAPRGRQRPRAGADDERRGRARRRRARVRGGGPGAGHLPPRRAAHRVGARQRPAAGRARRRGAPRGPRR